jgi:cellulase/cellobiase CelA1
MQQHTNKLLGRPTPAPPIKPPSNEDSTCSEIPNDDSGSGFDGSSKDSVTDEEGRLQPTLDEEATVSCTCSG